jgi:hypothetical protein
MIPLLESTLIFRFISKINKFFELTYRTSFLKKIIDTVKAWFQYSLINRALQNYLDRNSGAKHSYIYRFLSLIGRGLDFFVGKFGNFVLAQLKTSVLVTFLNRGKEEFLIKPSVTTIVFVAPLAVGFILVTSLRNTWSTAKFAYILLFALVGIVCIFASTSWKQWLKNSSIYKLCHNLWE